MSSMCHPSVILDGAILWPNTAFLLKALRCSNYSQPIRHTVRHLPAEKGGKDESLFIVTLNFRSSKEDFVGAVFLMAVTMTHGGSFRNLQFATGVASVTIISL